MALVRRKETTESPFNTTTGGQKVGKGSISGALGRLAGAEEGQLPEDGGGGGGGSENEEWRRQVAQAMCEGKGLGGGGGGELAKLLSKRREKGQDKGKGGGDKKIKLRERSSDRRELEGPDIPQDLKDRERFKVNLKDFHRRAEEVCLLSCFRRAREIHTRGNCLFLRY